MVFDTLFTAVISVYKFNVIEISLISHIVPAGYVEYVCKVLTTVYLMMGTSERFVGADCSVHVLSLTLVYSYFFNFQHLFSYILVE